MNDQEILDFSDSNVRLAKLKTAEKLSSLLRYDLWAEMSEQFPMITRHPSGDGDWIQASDIERLIKELQE